MGFDGCRENHKKTGKRYFDAFSGLQTTGERKEFAVVPQDNDPCVEPLYVPPRTSPTWLSPIHKDTVWKVAFWLTSR